LSKFFSLYLFFEKASIEIQLVAGWLFRSPSRH